MIKMLIVVLKANFTCGDLQVSSTDHILPLERWKKFVGEGSWSPFETCGNFWLVSLGSNKLSGFGIGVGREAVAGNTKLIY